MGRYRDSVDNVITSIECDASEIISELDEAIANLFELKEILEQDEYDLDDATSKLDDAVRYVVSAKESAELLRDRVY